MKIVFTAAGANWDSKIDSRFGRAEYLVLYNEEFEELSYYDNSAVKDEEHGAGTATAQKVFDLEPDVIITGNGPGEHAAKALEQLEVEIYINAHDLTLKDAYYKFKNGELDRF